MRPFSFADGIARGVVILGFLLCLSGCDADDPAGQSSRSVPSGKIALTSAARSVHKPRVTLHWPVPNHAYLDGAAIEAFVQPTQSGEPTSGLFGSVRSGGRQFHEGVDLLPLKRDARGEPADDVFAAMEGVVRHVNDRAGASSYGRYVVLEHPEQSPPVYTLYAHLAAIDPAMHLGREVQAGTRLGLMGRSAGGYTIPKDRAHLHFEIGVWMTTRFQAWYDGRKFGSKNEHGLYNGMNLMGLDPLDFFAREKTEGLQSLDEVFRDIPTAVTVRIAHLNEPDFVARYPSLVKRSAGVRGGWELDLSVTGVPVRWREIPLAEFDGWKANEARVLSVDQALLDANRGRDLVRRVKGKPTPGRDLKTVLEQLFAWKG